MIKYSGDPNQKVHSLNLIDLVAEATVIHQRLVLAAGTVLAGAFSGQQIDAPRNVLVVDNGVANAGDVIITGIDSFGNETTETIAITGSGTTIGNKAWIFISEIYFPTITNVNVEVQIGSKIGLGAPIGVAAQVKGIIKNSGAMDDGSSYTITTTYGTIEETGVPVALNDDFNIFYLA